jgi:hypothetical protein
MDYDVLGYVDVEVHSSLQCTCGMAGIDGGRGE